MSSLRERLEAKARRKAVVQVAVEDTMQARRALADAQMQRLTALASGTADDSHATAVDAAQAALDALYVAVELQALPPGDFEALVDEHTTSDGAIDRTAFLPDVLAASAVDESLQDPAWWAAQLATPRWTDGERAVLFATVNALNDPSTRAAAVPKG